MSSLSKETRERIEADALKYAEMIPDCLPHISYRRGALTEAERTQGIIDTLELVYKTSYVVGQPGCTFCDTEFDSQQLGTIKQLTT